MRFLRLRRPSPALVISCIALFVALGGTGYAVIRLPAGSVGTKQLKKNAVTSPKVRNDALTGADVNEATLGQVPSAAGATNAGSLDGLDSSAFALNGHSHEGLVLVSAPWANWDLTLADAGTIATTDLGLFRISRASGSATNQMALLTPDLPVAQSGKRLQLRGAELCYDATSTGSELNYVELTIRTHNAGASGFIASGNIFTDNTDRNDATCRLYTFPAPRPLTDETSPSIVLNVNFSGTGSFSVGRTTFILEATGENATAPS